MMVSGRLCRPETFYYYMVGLPSDPDIGRHFVAPVG